MLLRDFREQICDIDTYMSTASWVPSMHPCPRSTCLHGIFYAALAVSQDLQWAVQYIDLVKLAMVLHFFLRDYIDIPECELTMHFTSVQPMGR